MNRKTIAYIYLAVAVVALGLTAVRLANGVLWPALISGAIGAFAVYRFNQMREREPER